jgi:hypothetical protein
MTTRHLRGLVVTLGVAWLAATALERATVAQQPPPPQPRDLRPMQPPRDPSGQALAATGKGSISGVVRVVGTGQPARRARVSLSASGDSGGSRSMLTDDQGRFAFDALPAARFNLSASKAGHLNAQYGQHRPLRQGTPIQLAEGQRLQVQLSMWKGSVITGTVLDEHAEAVPGTPVRALRYVMTGGQRTLQSAGNSQTDDRGVYRIFGLQPGDYVVNAAPRNTGAAVDVERIQNEMRVMTERMQAVPAQNAADLQAMAERLNALRAIAPAGDEPASGYAPVYYPGTTSPSSAVTIAVGPGEEKGGIDFQYQMVPVARIEGFVTGGPTPQGITVMLVNAGFDVPGGGPGSARTDAQGAFRFNNVPPGQYTVVARGSVAIGGREGGPGGRGPGPAGRGMVPGLARGAAQQQTRLWASTDVVVDGRNLANVMLALQPGMSVSGRIAFEGSQPPPTDFSRARVTAQPIMLPGASGELMQSSAGTVDADGRFTIPSVVPGRYRVTASVPSSSSGSSSSGAISPASTTGWTLGSAMVDGQDSLDFPIEIKPSQNVGNVVLTFVDRQTELTGTIVDQRSQPVVDYNLIVYPADQRFWTPQSRRIQSARPATDGRFTFRNLPPGDYRIAPVLDPEPGSWYDPAFLQQLDGNATRITLGEGEKKEQTLRVAIGG